LRPHPNPLLKGEEKFGRRFGLGVNKMNKRIFFSLISIVVSLGLAAGGTFAMFSSTNSSTGNVFSSGTLALQLDDNNESASSSPITASFGGTNMVPGGTPVTGFISLHNSGTVNASNVGLDVTEQTSSSPDLASVIDVTVKKGDDNACTVNATDLTSTWATALGGGTLTLAKIRDGSIPNLPALTAGGTYFVCFTGQMESSADITFQGKTVSESFVFTANQ